MALNGHGSLINGLTGKGLTFAQIELGMGATELSWSDRHAFTVIALGDDGRTVYLRRDKATRVDTHGMSDCQSYSFAEDSSGETVAVRLTRGKRPEWRTGGTKEGRKFSIGARSEYYDYSF